MLLLVLIGKSELDVLVPNKGFATELLLLEDANNGFICEFLFELGWLEILLLVENRFVGVILSDLLMSRSLVCSVILFALILGFSSEFNWESLLQSSLILFLESFD